MTNTHKSLAAVLTAGKAVVLEVEIANVDWVNPHIRILLRTADVGDYSVEWFSLRVRQPPDNCAPTATAN